jgi:uncharacterized protein
MWISNTVTCRLIYSYTTPMVDHLRKRLMSEGHIDVMVRVRPHASKTELTNVLEDGSLKIAVAAPAEEGRGNTMLVKFLASLFDVPVSSVTILSGKTARLKLVRIVSS